MDAPIAALFAVWLVLSLIAQLPGRSADWIRARDPFGLVPSWSFFAPNPARTDAHLLYRHSLADGAVTDWTEAFVWRPVWYRFLWNPDRRAEKAISDATSSLQRRTHAAGVQLSISYLLLLEHVSHLPCPRGAVAVQFVLMGSWGPSASREPFVRFVSDTHPLGAAPARDGVEYVDANASA
jgi:hypothetical protein